MTTAGRAHALLLTGAPGVGKTTIVRRTAALLRGRTIRGFVTDEIRSGGQRTGFELSASTGHKRVLASVGSDSPHRVGRYGVDLAALDAIVDEVLSADARPDLWMVDEIGKMECLSERFCAAMRRLLDSGQPLVATVALHAGGFVAEVKARPDVTIVQATRQSRDALPARIAAWAERAMGAAR